MCDFCESSRSINTTIAEFPLRLSIVGSKYGDILKIRVEHGGAGMTRPIKIYYCPICGKDLKSK